MKDFVVIVWNFHGRGGAKAAMAMLRRCDLRHEAKQELDVRMEDPDTDEPWLTGSMGSVRLPKDDPRIPMLLRELKAAKVTPLKRVERVHSKKDLETEWLTVEGCTTMVGAGNMRGQVWDFNRACKDCGGGAVPVPPLIVRFEGKPPKRGWSVTVPCGLVVVSADVAAALVEAKLTGFKIEPVRTPSKRAIDPRFRWLRIPCDWPGPVSRPSCRIAGTCRECGRAALRGSGGKGVSMLHFDRVPEGAKDFNAWQGTVLRQDRVSGVLNREIGASPELIISHRAHQVLKEIGVKSLKCQPIRIG